MMSAYDLPYDDDEGPLYNLGDKLIYVGKTLTSRKTRGERPVVVLEYDTDVTVVAEPIWSELYNIWSYESTWEGDSGLLLEDDLSDVPPLINISSLHVAAHH
jgi:hypothetical protein